MTVTRTLAALAAVVLVAMTGPVQAQQPEGVCIDGDCVYDEQSGAVICTYSVTLYAMVPSRVYFPVPETCLDSVEIDSPCLEWEGPAEYCSDACGDFFGYRSELLTVIGQEIFFTIVYHGATEEYLGVLTVGSGVGGDCVSFDLPGVIGCYEEPYCDWSFDATEAQFYLRKPGNYAGRWCDVTLESNVDMSLHFSGFEDLMPDGSQGGAIPVWHGIGEYDTPTPPPGWFTAAQFNEQVVSVDGEAEITQFSIWTRVEMTNETTVGDYSDEATITVVMENNRTWIDIEESFDGQGVSRDRRNDIDMVVR
jgi:hypothetical protein